MHIKRKTGSISEISRALDSKEDVVVGSWEGLETRCQKSGSLEVPFSDGYFKAKSKGSGCVIVMNLPW